MKIILFVVAVCTSLINANASTWDWFENPSHFDANYEYRLSALPTNNMLEGNEVPWSETYWARNLGSINIRWNAPGRPGFNYRSPTKAEVQSMSREQLAQLAPSEKYDLVMGNYDYPTRKEVSTNTADQGAKDWEGICDGWTISATQKKEPKPVDITNPDGIVIPFGSSDVKGLMSYYAIKFFKAENNQVGKWCGRRLLGCSGVNAGAYHVVLANELGIKRNSFAVDISRTREIWNQPLVGFTYEIIGSALSHDTSRAVRVHSKMFYTDELEFSSWEPVVGTPNWKGDVYENEYTLELDQNGKIVGGEWISGKHPQIFWKPTKQLTFEGAYEGLNRIYQSAN